MYEIVYSPYDICIAYDGVSTPTLLSCVVDTLFLCNKPKR